MQARACGLKPVVDMNPVLLKPETDTGAQVILQGRPVARTEARDYATLRPRLLAGVLDSFARLTSAPALRSAIQGASAQVPGA